MSVVISSLEPNINPSYEPKFKHRYIVTFSEEIGIPNYVVKSASRPSCHIIDNKIIWDIIPFNFYDPISPSTSQSIMSFINNDSIFNSIQIKLEMVDPVGQVVERWLIDGKFLYFNFGEMDYSNDEPLTIHADFQVTNAVLEF